MKDVLGYILPFVGRYLQNLLLIVRYPFTVFSERAKDPRFFADSLLFLWISCVVSALITSVILGMLERTYVELLLGATGVAASVLLIAGGMFCSWWVFGYRGPPGAIMMPFIYAGGSLVFCSAVLAILGFGALKIYAPQVFLDFFALSQGCHFGASGLIDVAQAASEIGYSFDGPVSSLGFVVVIVLIEAVLLLSTAIGAYRTAFSVYRTSNPFFDLFLFAASLVFFAGALFVEQVFSAGIDGEVVECTQAASSP